jgi:hypothetical protein
MKKTQVSAIGSDGGESQLGESLIRWATECGGSSGARTAQDASPKQKSPTSYISDVNNTTHTGQRANYTHQWVKLKHFTLVSGVENGFNAFDVLKICSETGIRPSDVIVLNMFTHLHLWYHWQPSEWIRDPLLLYRWDPDYIGRVTINLLVISYPQSPEEGNRTDSRNILQTYTKCQARTQD